MIAMAPLLSAELRRTAAACDSNRRCARAMPDRAARRRASPHDWLRRGRPRELPPAPRPPVMRRRYRRELAHAIDDAVGPCQHDITHKKRAMSSSNALTVASLPVGVFFEGLQHDGLEIARHCQRKLRAVGSRAAATGSFNPARLGAAGSVCRMASSSASEVALEPVGARAGEQLVDLATPSDQRGRW